MHRAIRSLVVALLTVMSVLAITVSWSISTAVILTATTVLIMGGTGEPNPGAGYRQSVTDNFIDPFFGTDIPPEDQITVITPEQFAPFQGSLSFDASVAQGVEDLEKAIGLTDEPIIVLGYSQSTRIIAITRRNMIAAHGDDFAAYRDISFVMLADLNKPNGGMLARLGPGTIPFLEMTADGPAPTNSPENPGESGDYALDAKDFSFVYDGFSDFPVYPLYPLALINAIAGIMVLHPDYPFQNGISPSNPDVFFQGSHGDTDYYMIRSEVVPLLSLFAGVSVLRPIALFLDEPLQVLIEVGYEREASPGTYVPMGLIPLKNPITVALNFLQAIPVGFDNAAEDLGFGRPLNTQPSGPFGVGGPTAPIPDPTAPSLTTTTAEPNYESPVAASEAEVEVDADIADPSALRVSDSLLSDSDAGDPAPAEPTTVDEDTDDSEQNVTITPRTPQTSVLRGSLTADAPSQAALQSADDRQPEIDADSLTAEPPGQVDGPTRSDDASPESSSDVPTRDAA